MQKVKKAKPTLYVTEIGIAQWPYLITPDEFKGKKAYKVDLSLDELSKVFNARTGEDLGPLLDFVCAANSDHFEKVEAEVEGKKDKRGRPITVDEAEAPAFLVDGKVTARFKMNAEGEKKDGTPFTQEPAIFDKRLKPFDKENGGGIWSGSKLRVSFEVVPYHMASAKIAGVSLRLKAVQVVELVNASTGGTGAAPTGFAAMGGEDDDHEEGAFDNTPSAADDEGGDY